MTLFASSRARRIFGGWSANIVQVLLALTQQIVLIPLFLKFWTSDTLSAWLTIFAAGNLVLAADAGLPMVQMAVAWVMANPAVTAPIIGASRPDQLEPALAAAESPLPAGLKASLDTLTESYRRGDAAR